MGTVQPVGYRLAHANNWKSNWQNHSHQFADSAFRDGQLEKLINDFCSQYGILVSNLRVQEIVRPNGLPHLILTCTYYVRSKIFMKKMGFKDIQKQLPDPVFPKYVRGYYKKRRKYFKSQSKYHREESLNMVIKVMAPALVNKFLKEFYGNKHVSFDLRMLNTFKANTTHSDLIHQMKRLMRWKQRRIMRNHFSKDIYYTLHEAIITQDTKMLGDLIANLLEKTKRHHPILNVIQNLMRITMRQYKNVRGLRIKIKGRIGGVKRKRHRTLQVGRLALQEIQLPVAYSMHTSLTRFGSTSIKIWLV